MNGSIQGNSIKGQIYFNNSLEGKIDVIKEAIDTRDATATPEDIKLNKTAYARGKKLVGTYEGIIPAGTLTITENGEKDVYNYANVDVQIDTGSSIDWSEIGYEEQPSIIQESFDYSKEIMQNWDNTITDRTRAFENDGKLYFFPRVDTSNIINASNMFYNSSITSVANDFDFSRMTNTSNMFAYSSIKSINNIVLGNTDASSMFNYTNDLKINNFVASQTSNSMSFSYTKNVSINTIGIRVSTRTVFNNNTNLDIKEVSNYDNHTSRTRTLLSNNVMTDRTIDAFLKYFKTLTSQSSSYKTLKSMGFTQANSNQAILSSEWQGLVSAGWTTGY